MARPGIYNGLRAGLGTDFAFVVEDDIVPSDDAAGRLLRHFTVGVASCTGPYP